MAERAIGAAAGAATPVTHADLVRRLFDAKATGWSAKYAPGGPLVGRLSLVGPAVTQQVPPGGRVLDLGCGTGELARWLAGAGLRVAGCDISAEMLRRAAATQDVPADQRPAAAQAVRADGWPGTAVGWLRLDPSWRQLPLLSGQFDAVVATSVLEYTADPRAVLAECARVLRPGGVFVCTVPDPRHPVRWLEWLARTLLAGRAWADADHRFARYGSYLRASRQRHRLGWWLDAADQAVLRPAPTSPAGRRVRGNRRPRPLRLLSLRPSSLPAADQPGWSR